MATLEVVVAEYCVSSVHLAMLISFLVKSLSSTQIYNTSLPFSLQHLAISILVFLGWKLEHVTPKVGVTAQNVKIP